MAEQSFQMSLLTDTPTQEGYIRDPISGREVKATPENMNKVSFAKRLISEYGYSKEQIQTF